MKRRITFLAAAALGVAAIALLAADSPSTDVPRYTGEGRLVFPQNYREWVYLSSGLGMTYGPAGASGHVMFDNVFVNPAAYRSFLATGRWPDHTILVLEAREAQSKGSINRGGNLQGDVMAIEAHV